MPQHIKRAGKHDMPMGGSEAWERICMITIGEVRKWGKVLCYNTSAGGHYILYLRLNRGDELKASSVRALMITKETDATSQSVIEHRYSGRKHGASARQVY